MAIFKGEYLSSHGVDLPVMRIIIGAIVVTGLLAFLIEPALLKVLLTWAFIFSPLWAPALLAILFWNKWVGYVRALYIASLNPVLLEIQIPRDIAKTPRAMELVLTAMNVGPGETTFISRWWEGKVRPWWSLELVSIEGKVHFYVWTFESQRTFVESQFYAQFPDIEIHEVEDYMHGIDGSDPNLKVWGMEYAFGKPDAYPIKTYIDFELDQPVKDSETIADPISGVFEKLSALGPGEIVALQIIVRKNNGFKYDEFYPWSSGKDWKDDAKAEIEKMYEESKPTNTDPVSGEIVDGYPQLKPAQVNTIKALERSIDKVGYDVGIRSIYVTKKDSFDGGRIGATLVQIFSPFKSGTLNSFNPSHYWHVSLDYPWQDIGGKTTKKYSEEVIDAYRRRGFFHPPYDHDVIVMTPEELATIYHFPTAETKAPGIDRIPSTKGEAPANLPT